MQTSLQCSKDVIRIIAHLLKNGKNSWRTKMNSEDLQRWADTLDHNSLVNIIVQWADILIESETLRWDEDEDVLYYVNSGNRIK